jgi:hypothetical protein
METFYELPFGIEVFGSAKNAGYTRIGDEV